VKEFTISVSGRVFPKNGIYRIHAQNRKKAKEKALELFRREFGTEQYDNFDLVKILAVWQHKDKEAQGEDG